MISFVVGFYLGGAFSIVAGAIQGDRDYLREKGISQLILLSLCWPLLLIMPNLFKG